MKNIVIFASGAGSNADNIIRYFQKNEIISVVAVLSNNPKAKVLEKAKNLGVACLSFDKEELYGDFVQSKLNHFKPDLIVLAGFLWKFPAHLIAEYPDKIINIHPALLPKYGGKGMYGQHVHQAVLNQQEKETGITIHFVNAEFDKGRIIFQKSVSILNCVTPDEIAAKVHELEHRYFPEVINELLTTNA